MLAKSPCFQSASQSQLNGIEQLPINYFGSMNYPGCTMAQRLNKLTDGIIKGYRNGLIKATVPKNKSQNPKTQKPKTPKSLKLKYKKL